MKGRTTGPVAPPAPAARLSIGITGHRDSNPVFAANRSAIGVTLRAILDALEAHVAAVGSQAAGVALAPTRLHTLLVDGLDQLAAQEALGRGWELVAPLPFGRRLNVAINAHPDGPEEARFLLTGDGRCGAATKLRAAVIDGLLDQARLFELADQDEALASLYLAWLGSPADLPTAQAYLARASERVALAARVMIEQSDLIVAVWDGASTSLAGGTGHTLLLALELGAPVVWIDARAPERWRILHAPESLAAVSVEDPVEGDRDELLALLVKGALAPSPGRKHAGRDPLAGLQALDAERWRPRSSPLWHAYRRIEALAGAARPGSRFRSLTQVYESPEAIADGSGAGFLAAASALAGQEPSFVARIERDVLRRFAWADGVAARLSDIYRGGMVLSFLFSAFAIVGGIAYLPFATLGEKWIFATLELLLLAAILGITFVGQKRRWHGRWFETRRLAEYFRHAPILLVLGVARPPGRWPRGAHSSWPEWYARHALRDLGLPRVRLTPGYLRAALRDLLGVHVTEQRDYHREKADRLARTHRQLDRLSEALFGLAVLAVASYLVLKVGGAAHIISKDGSEELSKLFTFLGVLLPTFGGAIAGIRYFGDFERFSAISEVTAEKLDAVGGRIDVLLTAPDEALDYGRVSELAHVADDIVVDEIENRQAVFGGKHITVPA